MAEEKKKKGLLPEQKLKSYLVLDWLKKNTDRNHTYNADYIADVISEDYGISAERRSVYRDIDAINEAVLLAHEEAFDIEEARELDALCAAYVNRTLQRLWFAEPIRIQILHTKKQKTDHEGRVHVFEAC